MTDIRRLALVLAFACGLTVANLYYAQPLLDVISHTFDISEGAASVTVTVTQAGYVVGLLFLVPLGDLLENRALVTRTLLATAIALALAAVAPNFGFLLAAAALTGLTSVVAQVLVPLAAYLAPEGQVGRVVGTVMSGLLLGILLARTVASAVAEVAGWRTIYVVSAVLMVLLSLVLRRALPERRPTHDLSYWQAMASVAELIGHEPILITRSVAQATLFGAFTAYWTAIAFELVDEHGFNQGQIAVFALVGAAGAVGSKLAGHLSDRGLGEPVSVASFLLAAGSFAIAGLGHHSVVLLGLAAVLLDFSVQNNQGVARHVVLTLRANAQARLNTVFMVTMFLGGTAAAATTNWLHGAHGWTGVCWLGFVLPLVGFVIWLVERADHAAPPRRDLARMDEDDFVGYGGDLEPRTLIAGYSQGMFPMPGDEPDLLWWFCPVRRGVLPLDGLRTTRSLQKSARHFEVRVDSAFDEVVEACADPARSGAWIDQQIKDAYRRLRQLGFAHSVEAWRDGRLAGGLYGVSIGGLFAGESMFHRERDASKVALMGLVDILRAAGDTETRLLDVQWQTPHLASLGVIELDRDDYLARLPAALALPSPFVEGA